VPAVKLLQAMAGARSGGAELFFVRLAGALATAGVDQRLLVRRNGYAAGRLAAVGIASEPLPFGGWFDFVSRPRFAAAIDRFHPTVVLTWMNRATGFCPRPTPNRPFVHVARLGGYYNLKYYRACAHLIGNTRSIVDYIAAAGFPRERVHYLPNFVDAVSAAPASREQHATPADAPLLLALGRLHRNKGFDVLLHALADLPGVYLWVGGAGPLRDELAALARRLGVGERVRFLGWRDDVAALYAACDVFVCSSRLEPLGNVVIEAWAHRKPVVAAAAAGPAALIADAETGLKVATEDAPALARAVRRLLDEPALRQHVIESGYRAYTQEFATTAVVDSYRALFERIAA
jgi:glycosyltransferase involved in cell wall biosynthesis